MFARQQAHYKQASDVLSRGAVILYLLFVAHSATLAEAILNKVRRACLNRSHRRDK